MAIRETLQRILTDYPQAKTQALKDHPLAQFIGGEAESAVTDALGELGQGMLVEGSPGRGVWAAVPWISVFDPAITTSATRGYYVVYLFHTKEPWGICRSIKAPQLYARNLVIRRERCCPTALN